MLPDAEAAAAGDERYPLVVANILAGTLVELAPLIAARVAAGGTLLLSGIWGEEQATRVTEAYARRASALASRAPPTSGRCSRCARKVERFCYTDKKVNLSTYSPGTPPRQLSNHSGKGRPRREPSGGPPRWPWASKCSGRSTPSHAFDGGCAAPRRRRWRGRRAACRRPPPSSPASPKHEPSIELQYSARHARECRLPLREPRRRRRGAEGRRQPVEAVGGRREGRRRPGSTSSNGGRRRRRRRRARRRGNAAVEDGNHVARRVALALAARHPAERRGERHVRRVNSTRRVARVAEHVPRP